MNRHVKSGTYPYILPQSSNPENFTQNQVLWTPRGLKRAPNTILEGEVRRQPADPEFGQLVRKMFSLIKVAHHLRNVDPKSRKVEPKIITRMVEILSTMIKPAVPTPETMELIKDNAEAWGYNTISTLVNHYELGFDEVMFELQELMIPQWRDAFEVAVRWAKRNLPRITDEGYRRSIRQDFRIC
ncbi:hypothetical protein D5F01_LYC24724 [Xyrichtys novacula]|uniref:Uncharacterized protein n=1 Tax=Xyrichtys novacula TaxID=13765 RepID=A0AAV1G3N7_XYRNO|nr:hypothetical protein D5F01_LYC24724 [Xyrichtys novacula]